MTVSHAKPGTARRRGEDDLAIAPLTTEACYALVGAESLGRIGFTSRQGIEILPVGYRLGPGPRLFISTRLWGIVGQLAECGARCTFEVDHHGGTTLSGWSVLMRGVLSRLDRAGTAAFATLDRGLQAWPGYHDPRPVQFVPDSVTGRSVLRPT